MNRFLSLLIFGIAAFPAASAYSAITDRDAENVAKSWSADNGNGTYTNPLFYDEFSDPDILRVGEDYYLAGTTMHSVPGLVILHSKDLVNWENVSYCFDRFDFEDDAFSLKNGKEIYGQGIWAPCIRYNDGKFYLFSNVNGKGLQCFISDKIEGPWKHVNMQGRIYDLGVIFDDDGKIYAVHGYDEVKCTELKPDMSGPIAETEAIIIPKGSGVGEGHHIYKIDGKYYIISADYMPNGRLTCSRADNIWGPYETRVITADETFGYHNPPMTKIRGRIMPDDHPVSVTTPDFDAVGAANIHQGGIVSTPDGQWWSLLMQDFHSIGRTTCLVPVTWKDGWPMIGLEGNLGRAPRTWLKPETAARDTEPIHAPYRRNEDFNGKSLGRVWQWNHNPDDSKWKLSKGRLRLNTMPADQLMWARNTLTQRAIGPESDVTVELYLGGMKDGDVAGLGNINVPCSWIGVVNDNGKMILRRFEQLKNDTLDVELPAKTDKIWLRLHGDYDEDRARYCYSTDGIKFIPLGDDMTLSYQLITFQGSRPGLFAFNKKGKNGGYAEFDNFTVDELKADRSGNIPLGKTIHIINLATGRPMYATPHGVVHDTSFGKREPLTEFKVIDRGNGKVILQSGDGRYVFVAGEGLPGDVRLTDDISKAEEFMWQDYLGKEFMLMSAKTHKYIGKSPASGSPYSMDYSGSDPARRNGAVFRWEEKKKDIEGHLVKVGDGYAATSVNTAVFRASSLASHGDTQYISYYDPDGYLTLGKRKLGSDEWTLHKTQYKGNIKDAHNVASIGVDGDGYIHVSFDHHGHPLRYAKSLAPGSLELGDMMPMTGKDEQDVTYPEFYTMPDGDLIFAYRSGASGRGNLVLNRYDMKAKEWSRLHDILIDGEGKRNAYWQMYADPQGKLHLSWVWRETWLVETNHDLCYARSDDGGKTWKRSDGSLYQLPITEATAERAWTIPQNSELINQTSMTADSQGNPFIATYWRDQDSKVPQYRLVWHDGKEWNMTTVGNRTEPFSLSGGGTKMIPIARPRIVSDGKKACYLFRDKERGSKVSVAYTPHLGKKDWTVADLTDFSVDAWEPSYDMNLWNDERKLNVFVQTSHQGDGEKVAEAVADSEPVYVLEIDF